MSRRLTPVEHPDAPVDARDAAAAQNDGASRSAAGEVLYGLLPGSHAATPASARDGSAAVVYLPNPAPANDEALDLPSDDEIAAELANDPEFAEVVAQRRARWVESMERDAQNDTQQHADDAGSGAQAPSRGHDPHAPGAPSPAEGHDDDCT